MPSPTETLLAEIRDEIKGMRADLNAVGRDAAVVNRLTQVIELLETIAGVKEERDEENGTRLF